jgi:hypothetical protein
LIFRHLLFAYIDVGWRALVSTPVLAHGEQEHAMPARAFDFDDIACDWAIHCHK